MQLIKKYINDRCIKTCIRSTLTETQSVPRRCSFAVAGESLKRLKSPSFQIILSFVLSHYLCAGTASLICIFLSVL